MKCEKCGQEFSDNVYPLHILRCPEKLQPEQTETIQAEGEAVSENFESINIENTDESLEKLQPEQTETGKKKGRR